MSEPTLDDYKLRLILLNEWKSKSTIDKATKKINKRLGYNSITSTKVRYWFKRFDKGEDTSLFGKDSSLNISIRGNPNEQLNSLLFLWDEEQKYYRLIKCDNRLIEYSYEFEGNYFIVRYDLFLNEKKVVELTFKSEDFKMINEFLLLSDNEEKKLDLYKIDYKNLTINLLDSIDLNRNVYLIVDQLNPLKFMIFMYNRTFAMGEIREGKLILGDVKNRGYIYPFGERLMGPKLQGFYFDERMKFWELNLNTMEMTKIDVTLDLENELPSIRNHAPCPYHWSKNCFYGTFRMSDDQKNLLIFNPDELKWTNVQILTSNAWCLFVDSDNVMTLRVGSDDRNEPHAFYKLALRKPEKLENLAHLAVLRQSTLFGEDKYLDCVKKLFIND